MSEPLIPVRLRPITAQAIGTTAFFRNRPLYRVLLEELGTLGRKHYKVLFHASSIGAEVYSFIIQYLMSGLSGKFSLEVHATDLEPSFVEYARCGRYTAEILEGMTANETSYFVHDGNMVRIAEQVKKAVRFLHACNYLDFSTDTSYDICFLLNTLIYVPIDKQAVALDKISQYTNCFFVITAFHMDTIKEDLSRNGYKPVIKDLKAIHDAWTDRRVVPVGNELRPGIYAKWSLPEFIEVIDFEYKYCAIFRKSDCDI
jgi:chemotaxis methyl-accepting protein methylase